MCLLTDEPPFYEPLVEVACGPPLPLLLPHQKTALQGLEQLLKPVSGAEVAVLLLRQHRPAQVVEPQATAPSARPKEPFKKAMELHAAPLLLQRAATRAALFRRPLAGRVQRMGLFWLVPKGEKIHRVSADTTSDNRRAARQLDRAPVEPQRTSHLVRRERRVKNGVAALIGHAPTQLHQLEFL